MPTPRWHQPQSAQPGEPGASQRVGAYAAIEHAKSVTNKFWRADIVGVPHRRRGGLVNLAEIIDGHDAEHVAIISRNRTTTYGQLADLVARARGGFSANGIGEGDRVAIVCSNGVPFVVAYLATLGLGAVAVPLNPTSPAAELTHQIATVGAVAAAVDRTGAAAWRDVEPAARAEAAHGDRRRRSGDPRRRPRERRDGVPLRCRCATSPPITSPPCCSRVGPPALRGRRCSRTAACEPTSTRLGTVVSTCRRATCATG